MIKKVKYDGWKMMHYNLSPNTNRSRRARVILYVFAILATASTVSVADSDPKMDAVIDNLTPDQRIRIWTIDFRLFQGYFIRAESDSIYLGSESSITNREQGRLHMDSQETSAIHLLEIDRMWTIDNHGLGRGLLWAGGVVLVGGALTYGAGAQTLDEESLIVFFGATIAAAFFALYKGTTGSRETMVYSRFSR